MQTFILVINCYMHTLKNRGASCTQGLLSEMVLDEAWERMEEVGLS